MPGSWRTTRVKYLCVGMMSSAAVLAGCGGGGKSATGPSQSASLRRLEVEVVTPGTARLSEPSMLVRLAELIGWPRRAEAAGLPGCTVSVPGLPPATTNASGRAILTNVPVPNTVSVSCPNGPSGTFPVDGPPGSVVTFRVEARADRIEVRGRNESVSPSVSPPSPPSPPSPSAKPSPSPSPPKTSGS